MTSTPCELEVLVPDHGPITFYGDGLEAVPASSGRLTITRQGATLATIRDWVYWRVVTPAPEHTN